MSKSDSFVMSVRPSAWNNSAPTGQIFMKFDTGVFSKICPENSSFINPLNAELNPVIIIMVCLLRGTSSVLECNSG